VLVAVRDIQFFVHYVSLSWTFGLKFLISCILCSCFPLSFVIIMVIRLIIAPVSHFNSYLCIFKSLIFLPELSVLVLRVNTRTHCYCHDHQWECSVITTPPRQAPHYHILHSPQFFARTNQPWLHSPVCNYLLFSSHYPPYSWRSLLRFELWVALLVWGASIQKDWNEWFQIIRLFYK